MGRPTALPGQGCQAKDPGQPLSEVVIATLTITADEKITASFSCQQMLANLLQVSYFIQQGFQVKSELKLDYLKQGLMADWVKHLQQPIRLH